MRPLVATVVALVAALGAVKASCPLNWVSFEYNCYIAYKLAVPWATAREFCVETEPGADLVSVNDIFEDAFILSEFGNYRYWTGLNDELSEGTFVWSNGDPTTYVNWDVGKPNGDITNNCVCFWNFVNGGWSDMSCDADNPFICKMSMPI